LSAARFKGEAKSGLIMLVWVHLCFVMPADYKSLGEKLANFISIMAAYEQL